MNEYPRSTDEAHEIQLDSAIIHALWGHSQASVGDEVPVEVYTHFVGDSSDIRITVRNSSGRRLDRLEGQVYRNRFSHVYTVSDRAAEAIYFEAELRDHGLTLQSEEMAIVPPVTITNAQWSEQEARRGDILELTADVEGAPDGTEATIEIYEHDADEAHDFITRFSAMVDNGGIETQWAYEYHEDTDEIPSDWQLEDSYSPPEYFFRVIIGSNEGESGLLEFKDWVEISVMGPDGNPAVDEEYVVHLPDGSERSGQLDSDGYAREEDIPPGNYIVTFPNRAS